MSAVVVGGCIVVTRRITVAAERATCTMILISEVMSIIGEREDSEEGVKYSVAMV